MRTTFYKFFLILTTLFTFSINATWANKIVYLDVTDAPFNANLEYTTNMYIHYWVPNSDTKKYYQLVPKDSYQTINGRMVYRIELGNNANTSDEWWWRVCRNDGSGYYHYHKALRYNEYNWYRIQNKIWVYDESNDPGEEPKDKDGQAFRSPGLLTGGHIYFDNARTKWTGVIQFVVGHGSEMHTYTLTKINDTELYYLNLTEALSNRGDSWGISHTYYSFIANTSAWANTLSLHPEGVRQSDKGYSENYRRQGELLDGKVYFMRPKYENGQWLFDIYQEARQYIIYQRAMIRPTDGSYVAVADNVTYPANVNIWLVDTIKNLTQIVSKTYNSGTNKNYNPRVFIAGKIAHTYNSLNSAAYTFDGWGSEPSTTGIPTLTAPSTANAGLTHYISENTTVVAFFTAKQFTVTLDNQNATTAGTPSVTPSYGYIMPTITRPSRTGYTFGGYWTEKNGTGTQYYNQDGGAYYNKKWDKTANTTLYAKWTANKYTVKFNGNGSTSGSMADQSFTYDVAQNLTANAFSRTGYTFAGWNTNAAGTGTSYTNQQSVSNLNATNNGQITLYAQWTANKYTITLNANGGSGNTASVQATYASTTLTPTITNPTRTGYTFAGWYSADSGGVMVISTNGQLQASISGFTDTNKKWIATENKTLYAQWTANTYTVMLDNQGATSAGTTSVTATYASVMPPITPPTRTGYTFGGYYIDTNVAGTQYYNQGGTAYYNKKWDIASETTLYAKWTANEYTVNFNANGGSGTMESQDFTYDAAQNLTTNAFTRTGYTFAGWNTSKNGTGTSYTDGQSVKNLKDNDNGSLTLYAQWTCIAPTNVNISGNYIVFPGETIELTVSGDNIATDATYVWKKGDQVIPGQTTATLTIPNCVVGNAGNYVCEVSNGACSSSNNFTVKMYSLHGLTDPIDNWTTNFVFTKAEGNTATYLIELDGNRTYPFKVFDGRDYYGNDAGDNQQPTMTQDNSTAWTMKQNQGSNVYLQTTMPGIYTFTLNYSDPANPTISVIYPSKNTIYLNPNSWNVDNVIEIYTIYAWNTAGNSAFVPMELADCRETVYKAEIDAAYEKILFIRDDAVANDFNERWNQTIDIEIQNPAQSQYTITDWGNNENENKSSGSWGAYTPYYTISYDLNGHGTPISEDCIENGTAWSAPNDPEEVGYTFLGWRRPAITNDLTLYKTGTSSFIPTSNEQLTAQWQLDEFTVTWKVGGSDYAMDVVSVESPLMDNIPQNPEDDDLGCCADKFMGWSTSANPNESDVFDASIPHELPSITQNTTFHAVFATKAPGVGSSSVTFGDMGYEDKQTVESITLGDGQGNGDATITFDRGTSLRNDSKYYIIGNAVRAYAGNTITINATYPNTVIRKVTFTFGDGDGTNEITANSGTYVDGIWTENVESPTNNLILTIGGSTGHRRIASIEVTVGINGNEYINYVTTCPNLGTPTLGDVSIDKNQIDVRCNTLSSMRSAAKITFPNTANLTCPITVTASSGFLISTDQNASAKYTSSLTISPKKSAPNKGTIVKTVYVRADATSRNATYDGSITITKTEGEEETKSISITANVNCQSYVLNTVDHLGSIISTTENFANDIIANAPNAPEPDACSTSYTFAGWSMTEVAYGSPTFAAVTFPFVMPANDVTLYPVYICSKDYHRVTSDLDAENWAGDYLIAASETMFANGSHGGTTDVNCIGGNNSVVNPGVDLQGNVVKEFWGNQYKVAFVHVVDGYYVLQTQDGKYNYIGNNASSADLSATESLTTASVNNHPLSIIFDKTNNSVRITNPSNQNGLSLQWMNTSNSFRFGKSNGSIYLYKKNLYTSSLICETITAEDAMVTSTAGQTVKVNVTATMSGMTVSRDRTLTVESDNTDFAATITETATNTYNVAVNYKPSAEDNTDGTETATITIKVNNNPVTTFQVTGRHLPTDFVIAAKWGDNWYALPANCVNSGDSKQGILIDVDDINNPTSATAPTTTKYGLLSVIPSRQTEYGQSVLLTERVSGTQRALHQNGEDNENIWVYAQYANVNNENATKYEWMPTTNDLINYTFTHSASSRKLGVNENGVFGAYTTDVQVRLLPATFYEQVAVQVIKWKANSVIVMYTGAETTATTQVGTNAATDAQTLPDQKITHGIYELTTTQSLTANAGKILTICFGTTQVKVEVPLIVSEEVIASANGHDVVILNGGKLTAATTSYSYNTIYVYGGGKLAIPESAQLGVNNIILRAGGVATNDAGQEATYQYIYPQVDLKGTLIAESKTFLKYEYVTDYDHWYHLVLPFNASLSTITYPQEYYGENVKADNKGSWQIKRYAGEIRATGNYDAWKDIETEGATSTTAGKGYIFWGAPKKVTIGGDTQRQKWGIQRITMNKQAATAKNEENGNKKISGLSSYANVANNSGADNDQGWNLVGNPYMVNLTDMATAGLHACKLVEVIDPATGKWNGKWEWNNETDIRYLTIPSNHFDTYTAKTVAQTVPLVAGRAFFVQLEGEANGITFAAANRASLMPALLAENDDKPVDIETGIILSNETLQDEMNFWIKDGKTNDYEYNADYPKTPNNNRFNIYGVHTNGDLSWVAISPEFAAESMPIGYQVPAAGTYMLSLSETYYSDDLQALYVTDHGVIPEVTTDLLSGSYEFSVNQAETNNERFTVSVILKTEEDDGGGDVGTGVDNAANNNTPCKFIYQDKMYILQNGVIYDAMGKQVKTINK